MNKNIKGNYLKIAFIDDEKLVRMLLINCVDWDSLGFKVVGDSQGGHHAINMVREMKPDIVFVDICMPIIDGIQMSKSILEIYPDCKIMMVTGHQDFNYARESLKIGVCDYILKPINPNEIMNAALKAKNEIDKKKVMDDGIEKLKNRIEDNYSKLKEQYLESLVLLGCEGINKDSLDYYGIDISGDIFQIALLCLEGVKDSNKKSKIHATVGKVIADYKMVEFFECSEEFVLLSNNIEFDINNALEDIKTQLSSKFSIIISCGSSESVNSISDIKKAYSQAKKALEFKVVCGRGNIISYSNTLDFTNNSITPQDSLDEFKISIKSGLIINSQSAAAKALDDLMTSMVPCPKSLYETGVQVLLVCTTAMKECGISKDDLTQEELSAYKEVLLMDTLPQMKIKLVDFTGAIARKIFDLSNNSTHKTLDEIRNYLHDNIDDYNLSLSNVADKFYLNHSYLSRIYKKAMGITFTEEINKIRMEKVIDILREDDMKVYELCEKVGVDNPHYLSILFKKFTGMTISDYKSKLKSQSL